MAPPATTGQRLATHRRRRGLSQAALAGLVGRSESWLSQVERGVRSVDRLSVLLDMARVLHVDVEALTGRPWQYAPNGSQLVEGLDGVRRVLARYDALTRDPVDQDQLVTAEALHGRAADIHVQYQAANYGRVIRELSELIVAADQVHMAANGHRELMLGYVSVYVAAAKLLTKLGSADLAAVDADRAAMTAGTVDSQAAQGVAVYQVVCALLRADRTDEAESLAVTMASRLTPHARSDEPALLSITGALWLIAAVIAGRGTDRGQAWARLDQADALA